MLKKILYAKFHSSDTHIPTLGSIGDSLPGQKTWGKCEMSYDGTNLFITLKLLNKGSQVNAIIPSANIKIMQCAEDEAVTKPVEVKIKAVG